MVYDELPLALPFYDKKEKQDRYKENIFGNQVFELYALNDRLLPFQFRHLFLNGVLSVQIFTADDIHIGDFDLTKLTISTVSGYGYYAWLGEETVTLTTGALLNLPCSGQYYIKVNFYETDSYWSEVFTIIQNDDDYLKLEWSNLSGDIDPIYYGSGFVNRIYIDTFITKGIPTITIESEKDGYGNVIPVSKTMVNTYDFSLLIVPCFILDAMNFMELHDTIKIYTKNSVRTGLIQNVSVAQDQVNNSSYFEVIVSFNQDKFYFNSSCGNPIASPIDDSVVIDRGTPIQEFDTIYDANN